MVSRLLALVLMPQELLNLSSRGIELLVEYLVLDLSESLPLLILHVAIYAGVGCLIVRLLLLLKKLVTVHLKCQVVLIEFI